MGFTIGIIIIFLYYLIVPFLDMLAQTGIVYPVISAWIPNIMITGTNVYTSQIQTNLDK